jgi:GntR family transcriptional repressor for pyruvate dehydrogenase complex
VITPTRERLTAYLREGIVTGRFERGTKLPSERALAEEFSISRPIVREVLRGLADQGLLDIESARGSFVRAPETLDGVRSLDTLYRRKDATVRELMEVRLMLETNAARLAALNATASEVGAMRWCLNEFANARHVLEEAQVDLAFHALIIKASHNTVVDIIYASISSLVFELMLRSLSDQQVKKAGAPLHEKLWEAIRAHDPDAASSIMSEHLTMAEYLYGDDYDRSVDVLATRELRRHLGPAMSIETILAEVNRRHAEFLTRQLGAHKP